MTSTRTSGIAPRSLPCQLRSRLAAAVAIALCTLAPPGVASAETADEFVARLNSEFADIYRELNAAGWTQATYITVDTQWLSARANERFLAAFSKAVEESKQFDGKPMSAASRRAIDLLRQGVRRRRRTTPRSARNSRRSWQAWKRSTARPGTARTAARTAATKCS